MRTLVLLCLLLAVYWYYQRAKQNTVIVPVMSSPQISQPAHTPTPSSASSAVKRPFDRTKEALDANKKRVSDGF